MGGYVVAAFDIRSMIPQKPGLYVFRSLGFFLSFFVFAPTSSRGILANFYYICYIPSQPIISVELPGVWLADGIGEDTHEQMT